MKQNVKISQEVNPKTKQIKHINNCLFKNYFTIWGQFFSLFLVCTNLYIMAVSLELCNAAKQILFVYTLLRNKRAADHFQPVFIFQFNFL